MATGLRIACVNYVGTAGPGAYELAPASSYAKVERQAALPLAASDSPNFVYAAGRPLGNVWLYAIKTQRVESGKVEVHVIDRPPIIRPGDLENYGPFIRQEPSAIDVVDGRNFDFLVGEFGDLICVKRRNTESTFVEVHVLIWDKFRHFTVQAPTPIPLSRADSFDFAVTFNNRLVAIERAGTEEQKVVLNFLAEDYLSVTRRVVTSLGLAEARELVFRFEAFNVTGTADSFMNLLGFTRGTTASGRVELIKLPQPWTGAPDVFPTPIKNALAPNFQYVVLWPPPRI